MRLRVAGLLLATALAAEQVSTRVDVYDDGLLRAWMPSVRVSTEGPEWALQGGLAIDSLSGATRTLAPDAWSGATRFTDRRKAGDLAVTHLRPEGSVTVGWGGSFESDYHGQSLSLTTQRGLRQDSASLVLALSGGWGLNSAQGADSSDLNLGVDADLSQVLGPRTVAGLVLSGQQWACGDQLGCHASPYRYVLVFDQDEPLFAARERHPDTRSRVAVGLRLSRSLSPIAALHAKTRLYADDWGVKGATVTLNPALSLWDDRLLLRATVRGSGQTGASFWVAQPQLTDQGVPGWRSADRELEPAYNLSAGLEGRWTWYAPPSRASELQLDARVQRTAFHYTDSADRQGWLAGGGLHVAF